MKKIYFLVVLLCASVSSVMAQRIESGGLYFNLEEWNGMTAYVSQDESYKSMTEVTIPSTVQYDGQTYTVDRISYSAFYECEALTTVTMPNTIKEIHGWAFYNCRSLQTVNMSNTLTYIAEYAFHDCHALMSITLPNTLTRTDDGVFCRTGLVSIDIPSSLTNIKARMFEDCHSLASVNIPNTVTEIGNDAFIRCKSLTTISLPDGITRLGSGVFQECLALTSINIPKGITKIESSAFRECDALKSVVIPDGVTSIAYSAFRECDSLSSVSFPNTLTRIENYVFYGSRGLKSINIPRSVKEINEYAFYYCDLDTLTISTNVTLSDQTFGGNSELIVNIHANSIKELVEGNVMSQLYEKAGVDWQEGLGGDLRTSVRVFIGGVEQTGDLVIPEGTSKVNRFALCNCSELSSVEVPSTVSMIGEHAFYGLAYLNINATTPPTITSTNIVDENAFIILPDEATLATYQAAPVWSEFGTRLISKDAMQMREVTVTASNSLSSLHKTIGEENLMNTIKLKVHGTINSYDIMLIRNKMLNLRYLDLSDAEVKACSYEYYSGYCTHDNMLEDYSFSNLNLQVVHLPKNLTEIRNCFNSCPKLDTVYFQPGLTIIGDNTFQDCRNLRYVKLDEGVTRIGSNAFRETHNLKYINLPNSLEYIGYEAFYNSGLPSITFPANLSYIEGNAFQHGQLQHITFAPNCKLQQINSGTFQYQYNLQSIDWEHTNITTINSYAFHNCHALNIKKWPKNLRRIEYNSFESCNMDTINLPRQLEYIGYGAFSYCNNLKVIKIPSSVRYIENEAFNNCNNVKEVYTYTIEPTKISQQTFSCYKTATLYVPATSYYNYYYNTQWSQFLKLKEFDEEYDYFYIFGDYYLGGDYGVIKGDPDGDLFAGSGLIIEGNKTVDVHNLHYYAGAHEYNNWNYEYSSIISNNNLSIDTLFIHIPVNSYEWSFISFPFDINREEIHFNSEFVVRYYDGQIRAENGSGGWQNVPVGKKMNNGNGYIVTTSNHDTLTLVFPNPTLPYKDISIPLYTYASESMWDENWNFIANPYLSYYDMDSIPDLTYPVVSWNGWGYDTYRKGDDIYHFKPLESFFIQNVDMTKLTMPINGRETNTQANSKRSYAPARRNMAAETQAKNRWLVDITMSDSVYTDRTRVVFNEEASVEYDLGVDANKMMSTTAPVQLYSIGKSNEQYSINERPATTNGEVIQLGYYAAYKGTFTLSVSRMDTTFMLYDNVENQYVDLSQGDYIFDTEAGFNNSRFAMYATPKKDTTTSLEDIQIQDLNSVTIYTMTGQTMAENVDLSTVQLPAGVYMIKTTNGTHKVILK